MVGRWGKNRVAANIDRGAANIDEVLVRTTLARPLQPASTVFEARLSETGDMWIERLSW